MNHVMRKPTFHICEDNGADQLSSNCKADQRLCFHYMANTIPVVSNPKFLASSHLLCLYSSVCVEPVWELVYIVGFLMTWLKYKLQICLLFDQSSSTVRKHSQCLLKRCHMHV